jgi:hypothetical protein
MFARRTYRRRLTVTCAALACLVAVPVAGAAIPDSGGGSSEPAVQAPPEFPLPPTVTQAQQFPPVGPLGIPVEPTGQVGASRVDAVVYGRPAPVERDAAVYGRPAPGDVRTVEPASPAAGPVAGDGLDWGDAGVGIGIGLAAALLAAGLFMGRRLGRLQGA